MSSVSLVEGDLLDQDVDVIVNGWNRNVLPWWLLWPRGISGAIKRSAGLGPFRELARMGTMPLGSARLTAAGRLPFRGIIHVAGIDLLWRASEQSVRVSTRSALQLADREDFASLGFPTIGAGTGGLSEERVVEWMSEEAGRHAFGGRVVIVRFRP